jgi:hypothetical protein
VPVAASPADASAPDEPDVDVPDEPDVDVPDEDVPADVELLAPELDPDEVELAPAAVDELLAPFDGDDPELEQPIAQTTARHPPASHAMRIFPSSSE